MAGLLQLKVNQTMEPKPSPGNVFIQRIGNSQVNYTSDTGLQLSLKSKNEWPAGNYTLNGPKSTLKWI
uniref:Uncharacterized protein n=1 Tax=Ditylenchus dipsaci TaxID=166011 RepID=A0A915DXD3_9BILA